MSFISLPKPDASRMQAAGVKVAKLEAFVQQMKDGITALRSGAAGAADKVSAVASGASSLLAELQADLGQLQADLAAVEARASQLKSTLPTVFALLSFLVTLILAWLIYSQVVLIRQAWENLHAPTGLEKEKNQI